MTVGQSDSYSEEVRLQREMSVKLRFLLKSILHSKVPLFHTNALTAVWEGPPFTVQFSLHLCSFIFFVLLSQATGSLLTSFTSTHPLDHANFYWLTVPTAPRRPVKGALLSSPPPTKGSSQIASVFSCPGQLNR